MTEEREVYDFGNGTKVYEKYFDWDSKQQGLVLSSFFYGYACTQFIGGIIAAKVGGHIVSVHLKRKSMKVFLNDLISDNKFHFITVY